MSDTPRSAPADTELPPPPTHRVLGVLLAAIAIGAIAFGALSPSWLRTPDGNTHVGLRDNTACIADACEDSSNADMIDMLDAKIDEPRHFLDDKTAVTGPMMWRVAQVYWGTSMKDHPSGVFAYVGQAAFGLGAVAIVALFIAAAIAAAGRRVQLPLSPCTVALVSLFLGLITAFVFVASKPGPPSMFGFDFGFFSFGGGVVFGAAGALVISRAIRPHDPDLLADAMDAGEFDDV